MNRWIRFMIKCAKVYNSHPVLVENVINKDKPSETFDQYYSEDERKQLKELSNQLNETKKKVDKLKKEIVSYKEEVRSQSIELGKLRSDKQELKDLLQNISNPDVPDWLDEGEQVFHPRTIVVKPDKSRTTVELPLTDFYTVTPEMKQEVEDLVELPLDEKLKEVWKIVVDYNYRHDYSEDWRISQVTYHGGADDCDGLASLYLALSRAAGVSPEKLFLGLGHYGKYGHAFPIVRKDGEFYIYEATLNSVKDNPKKLSGSNYSLDWGVANWEMYGMVNENTSTSTNVETDKRLEPEDKEEFEEKKKKIRKDWK